MDQTSGAAAPESKAARTAREATKGATRRTTGATKKAGEPAAARQRQGQNAKEKPEKRQKKSGKKDPKPAEMVTSAAVQPRVNRHGTKKCVLCHEWLPTSKLNKKEECLDTSACTKQQQAGLGKRIQIRNEYC